MIVKRYVSKGFTLIELIVVIIILGILSVAVAPKFLSFDSDAYKATLKAAEGSMHTSVDMFTAYAQVKGSNGSGTFEGIYIDQFVPWAAGRTATGGVHAGYDFPPEIFKAAGIDPAEWRYRIYVDGTYQVIAAPLGRLKNVAQPTRQQVVDTNCYINYKWLANEPVISIVTTGC
ncbi:pilin structural protein V10 [Shewanella sp. NFH-SH190041]|uniref:prepilin-type N-terminal cleavage/methylation domain-containing protein n=1 Tax=Shewanella sp. NFH-SH190041 TaxID=2950245 RepID=UPI0021C40ABF|nr:prepilin-type N-terminal cleavage/methylation domain-containing protein [Shewanella sp. NFH-SH190041]BDM62686.1 pilin structural protein V10 [Shewanella sp. NFH-SH190041]